MNCSPKHASQLAIRQQTDYGNIRIYTRLDTLKFRDENFKDEVRISYLKIDLEEAKISYANETFLEGEQRDVPNLKKIFKSKESNYYVVTSANTFEIPKSVSKYKRAWNDFATPGRSVTRAKKYTVSGNSIRSKNSKPGSSHVFDPSLTLKANEN
ncbi:hypothetical protein ACFSX9_04685 [Flavobacterium ardleyense]|uniref:Uncharacterized protein n=1 Tax=Flavobacterium ardleyense TaxID=2038737 RepID=A0ABW5Z6V9_9FLAO